MVQKKFLEKDRFKREVVKTYEVSRRKLASISHNLELPMTERFQARLSLHLLPRDSSATRVRNRCVVSSRPRGVYRKFKVSRIVIREMVGKKLIPGLKKSSW